MLSKVAFQSLHHHTPQSSYHPRLTNRTADRAESLTWHGEAVGQAHGPEVDRSVGGREIVVERHQLSIDGWSIPREHWGRQQPSDRRQVSMILGEERDSGGEGDGWRGLPGFGGILGERREPREKGILLNTSIVLNTSCL